MKYLFKSFTFLFALSLLLPSCVEEDFDQPPSTGVDPGLTVTTTIAELVAMHTLGDGPTEINEDLIIKGIVVADDFSGNWYRSFVIQDETGGITVLIDQAESYFIYPVGREIYIKAKGLSIDDYNNLVQLGAYNPVTKQVVEIANISDHVIGSVLKEAPAPKVLSITQLSQAHVNTLIQLNDVYFPDTTATFADAAGQTTLNVDLFDCLDNEVIVRTSGFADFAGSRVPSGGGTFVGILSVFRNDYQLLVRDLRDLDMTGERCGNFDPCAGITLDVVDNVNEDFENGSNNDPVVVSSWTNFAAKGSRLWQFKEFDGNVYCQATAFNDSSPEMEAWLITPGINLATNKSLSFETAKAFWTHNGLSVWVSSDFTCDPTKATWQPLSAKIAGQGDADHAWVPSGVVDLSGYTGQTVVIGFKYEGGNNSGLTASYRVDNVKVQ